MDLASLGRWWRQSVCHICKQAADEKKLVATNSEPAYIKNGYSNWKDAVLNFTKHENSICQKDAVLKMVTAPKSIYDVGELLSKEHQKEKADCPQSLLTIIEMESF